MATLTAWSQGLTGLDWPWVLLIFALSTQATIFCTTLYLHRAQAHRGVDLHPLVSHVMRLWLWLTTAMVTREWVAVHRKHHAHCETHDDPHSPVAHGLWNVLRNGVALYRREAADRATYEKYGKGCPDDWLERNVYGRYPSLGPTVFFFLCVIPFGVLGITFWALQMAWIPVFAAGVVNGFGHAIGYRNFETDDASTNVSPWGFFIGGEELHNNHHAYPSSAKFSMRRFEFDIGWAVLKVLGWIKLANVRRVAPALFAQADASVDLEAVKALMAHRFRLLSDYFGTVIQPTVRAEAAALGLRAGEIRRAARAWLRSNATLDEFRTRSQLNLGDLPELKRVLAFRQRLTALWRDRAQSQDALIESLKIWCDEAERSGSAALEAFAARLRGARLVAA
jgi:stearoyl-CoA desaturase (Delta-9 desaturase)